MRRVELKMIGIKIEFFKKIKPKKYYINFSNTFVLDFYVLFVLE